MHVITEIEQFRRMGEARGQNVESGNWKAMTKSAQNMTRIAQLEIIQEDLKLDIEI
jgi:carbamoylphosphate synthase large subunit